MDFPYTSNLKIEQLTQKTIKKWKIYLNYNYYNINTVLHSRNALAGNLQKSINNSIIIV